MRTQSGWLDCEDRANVPRDFLNPLGSAAALSRPKRSLANSWFARSAEGHDYRNPSHVDSYGRRLMPSLADGELHSLRICLEAQMEFLSGYRLARADDELGALRRLFFW